MIKSKMSQISFYLYQCGNSINYNYINNYNMSEYKIINHEYDVVVLGAGGSGLELL